MTSSTTMNIYLIICAEKDLGFLFSHYGPAFDVPMALWTYFFCQSS